ncbi:hypothetical protein DAI22_12g160600 [Oryza sativa Japonica Group]|nr:hypothetical protein DAI22_12g160600 [Oryza sativa Japonica Group]
MSFNTYMITSFSKSTWMVASKDQLMDLKDNFANGCIAFAPNALIMRQSQTTISVESE